MGSSVGFRGPGAHTLSQPSRPAARAHELHAPRGAALPRAAGEPCSRASATSSGPSVAAPRLILRHSRERSVASGAKRYGHQHAMLEQTRAAPKRRPSCPALLDFAWSSLRRPGLRREQGPSSSWKCPCVSDAGDSELRSLTGISWHF